MMKIMITPTRENNKIMKTWIRKNTLLSIASEFGGKLAIKASNAKNVIPNQSNMLIFFF